MWAGNFLPLVVRPSVRPSSHFVSRTWSEAVRVTRNNNTAKHYTSGAAAAAPRRRLAAAAVVAAAVW